MELLEDDSDVRVLGWWREGRRHRWLKTLLISRIPKTPLLLAGRHTGIGVWYTKLAVVVGAECEFGFGVW